MTVCDCDLVGGVSGKQIKMMDSDFVFFFFNFQSKHDPGLKVHGYIHSHQDSWGKIMGFGPSWDLGCILQNKQTKK